MDETGNPANKTQQMSGPEDSGERADYLCGAAGWIQRCV